MTTFNFTRDIPNPPNNPSVDVPKMKINNNSIQDLINVDHYGFNLANGGTHKQVQMPNLLAIPPGLFGGEGTLYTKAAFGESQLFYTPDASGNEYEMTRATTADFSKFGNSTIYSTAGLTNFNGGWTFLPGGLKLNYGTFDNPSDGLVVPYASAFTVSGITVLLTLITPGATANFAVVSGTEFGKTSFTLRFFGGGAGLAFIAIGK